ncbi:MULTISPECIES: MFS transporter [Streptomyces]|uniref:Major facilitator superfamily protein n=1 Tax=Streptomyces venezuelae (strain ATCC 10712 / CBS 650.69 / DSM 40230 / JCM 4526 / NBRC 13096 / PD 04745) TaxID=953739 RepID=F2R7D6_STRVP|nr:MFS transporter [Streptomyces venezuelae]APE19995.1 MFS transporter [Streptomyces venezuelae]QER97398.1 MFS transporter [Streptomyces venezuelae ATCC 10712]CCA53828.1 major facilitator superfamily protein [Streptomyces venezuelae ATCC 10712]
MTRTGASRFTLINRDYTRLWFGQAVSSVGDAVFSTTLVLWVATVLAKDESWAPMAVSGVLMASSAAVLVIGPLAGVFVDRWDKVATLLRTEVVRGALVALLTVVSLLPTDALPKGVWLGVVYVTVLLLHAAGQFFSPARFAILADLVKGEADRARAAGIGQATGETAWIIGPPLAAPLLFAAGLQWALLFNALSYAVSYIAIRSIDLRPAPPKAAAAGRSDKQQASLRREFVAGVRFFARSRFLVALLLLAVIGQFGIGALSTLNVFFTTDNLHADAHLYGYIGMAMGVGGITGALCGGRVVQWLGARRSTWISLLVSGVLLVAYSRQTGFLGGVALLFVFTVPLTVLNTAMAPLLLAAAPSEFRGRVMAVFYPVTKLASMLAAVLSGWLAGSVLTDVAGSVAGVRFGPIDTIFAASGVIVVLAGVFAWLALPGTRPDEAPGDEAPGDEAPGDEAPDDEPARTTATKAAAPVPPVRDRAEPPATD